MADINRPSRVLKNFTATPPLGSISTSTCSSAGMASSTESMACWITGPPFIPPERDHAETIILSAKCGVDQVVWLELVQKIRCAHALGDLRLLGALDA